MITPGDAIDAVELKHHYAIQPAACRRTADARSVPDSFQYSIDTTSRWIACEQLAAILKHASIEL